MGERTSLRRKHQAAEVGITEQPLQFGRGKIGVGHEPGALAEHGLQSFLPKLAAPLGGAAVLPDDGPGHRGERAPVPEHHCLPLIGDAESHRPLAAARDSLAHGFDRNPENFVGVVLDPPGLGKVLGEFPVSTTQHRAVLADDQRGGAGGALVEGEDGNHSRIRR